MSGTDKKEHCIETPIYEQTVIWLGIWTLFSLALEPFFKWTTLKTQSESEALDFLVQWKVFWQKDFCISQDYLLIMMSFSNALIMERQEKTSHRNSFRFYLGKQESLEAILRNSQFSKVRDWSWKWIWQPKFLSPQSMKTFLL